MTMQYNRRSGFAREKDKINLRPGQMVVFMECKNVRVENDNYIRAIENTFSESKESQFSFVHLANIDNIYIDNMQLDISEDIMANMNKLIYSEGIDEDTIASIKYLKNQ